MPVALAGAVLFTLAPSTPAAAAGPTTTEAAQIIQIAKSKLGAHWRYGATGPTAFDCSGLVRYAYRKAGDGNVIKAGSLASARSIYRYFKAHGKASRTNPKPGDLVIWGGGTHIGIYIGRGKAISTLTSGVRIHGVFAVTARFTAYLHTGMSVGATPALVSPATPAPTATLAPTATPVAADPTATPVAAAPTTAPAPVAAARTWVRQARYTVNLRRGPSVAYARIRSLHSGTRLAIFGRQADSHGRTWYHVRVAGRTGWVAGWLTR